MFCHACETVQTWERTRLGRVAGRRGEKVEEAAAVEPARGYWLGDPKPALPPASQQLWNPLEKQLPCPPLVAGQHKLMENYCCHLGWSLCCPLKSSVCPWWIQKLPRFCRGGILHLLVCVKGCRLNAQKLRNIKAWELKSSTQLFITSSHSIH